MQSPRFWEATLPNGANSMLHAPLTQSAVPHLRSLGTEQSTSVSQTPPDIPPAPPAPAVPPPLPAPVGSPPPPWPLASASAPASVSGSPAHWSLSLHIRSQLSGGAPFRQHGVGL